MMSIGRPPLWALALVADVCDAAGTPRPAQLRWRRAARAGSSGTMRYATGTISVNAGTDALEARLTLLHELAHWIGPASRRRQRRRHHDAAFWRRAFALYAAHEVPGDAALQLEARRYPGMLSHAVAMAVPGAGEAYSARRAALAARPRLRWRVLVAEHQIRLARDGRWTVCGVCGHRLVGPQLARLRRHRRPGRHQLLAAAPVSSDR
jgi:hypothetical protein